MRAVPLVALTAALTIAAATAFPAPDPDWKPHMAGLPFVVGLDRGREESRFMGLPQMLFFTSPSDMECPRFAARTWKDAEVLTKIAGWTPVLIDFDSAPPELKAKYKVEFVPSVVWLDHDEKYLYACYGDAPIDIFRKEFAKVHPRCPKAKEPGEGLKALLEAKKRLDDAATAKDLKAGLAAIAEIRKIRLGEAVQAAARAEDERLTKEGLERVATCAAVLDEKKSTSTARTAAKKGLEELIATYGGDHAVGREAKSVLDRVSGKKK